MKYLSHTDFIKSKQGLSTIFINNIFNNEAIDELKDIACSNLSTVKKSRNTEIIQKKEFSAISKTNFFRHRNNRLQVTFGIKRRGTYDRNVAEIYNQLKLSGYEYIPKVYCYGYQRNKFGIVTSTTLITEYVNNSFNIIEFIDRYPDFILPALRLSFDTIFQHLGSPHIHLDLWAGNILVTKDLTKSWIIDVEYFKFTPKRSIEEKFGFCLGYFYRYEIVKYISMAEYEHLANKWMFEKNLKIDRLKTLEICNYASLNKISRKERFIYF